MNRSYTYFGQYMNREYYRDDKNNIYCVQDNKVYFTGHSISGDTINKAAHRGSLEPYHEVHDINIGILTPIHNSTEG